MAQIGWIFDRSKCTACRGCINACKFENNTTLDQLCAAAAVGKTSR